MSGPLPVSAVSKSDRTTIGVQATITAPTSTAYDENVEPGYIGCTTVPQTCPQQAGILPGWCTGMVSSGTPQVRKNSSDQEMITIVSNTSCDKYMTQQLDDIPSPDVKTTCDPERNSISITVSEVKKKRLLGYDGGHGSPGKVFVGNLGGKIQYRTLKEVLDLSGGMSPDARPVRYVLLGGDSSENTMTDTVTSSFGFRQNVAAREPLFTQPSCGGVKYVSQVTSSSFEPSFVEVCPTQPEQPSSLKEVAPASETLGPDSLQFEITNTLLLEAKEQNNAGVSSTSYDVQTPLKIAENGLNLPENRTKSSQRQVVQNSKRSSEDTPLEILPNKRKIRLTAKGLGYVKDNANLRRMYDVDSESFSELLEAPKGTRPKRSGLSLELKVDIIKRVNSGEKQSDVADEYGINIHTVKTIVKKSSVYLECWSKGAFNPETMRIKGAKREDLENVLYYWYQNSLESGSNLQITGSVLCSKAVEFAQKLGYSDFKASHGWLDRFKKRKGIVFIRPSAKKLEEAPTAVESTKKVKASPLADALLCHDPSNVFTLLETGLFYKTLPSNSITLQGERCSGGIHGKERISVLMCTNMTATEKFPLLVVGEMSKGTYRLLVKDSPVQYISDEDSWFTKESIFAWLLDLDDWFAQHRRKVMIILSNLPIHEQSKNHQFSALALYQLPTSSMLPLLSNVLTSFKLNYRQALLIEFINCKHCQLQQASLSPSDLTNTTPKFTMSLYIGLLGDSWQNISEAEIIEGFQRAGINRYGGWAVNHPQDALAKARSDVLQEYKTYDANLPADYSWESFVHFDDALQVCDEFSVDDMIAKVLGTKDTVVPEVSPPVTGTTEDRGLIEESLHVLWEFVETQGQTEMLQVFQHFQELLKNSTD